MALTLRTEADRVFRVRAIAAAVLKPWLWPQCEDLLEERQSSRGADLGATYRGVGLGLLSLVCLASILVETSRGWGLRQTACRILSFSAHNPQELATGHVPP